MIELLKLVKNPRIKARNGWNIRWNLLTKGRPIELRPTSYYDGLALRPNCGDWICFEQIFRYLCYGTLERLTPIRTVIDAGANIGLASVFFTKRLGAPEIVGLEPEDKNFDQAVRNTRHLPNVEILKAALWPRHEKICIRNLTTSGSLGFQVDCAPEPGVRDKQGKQVEALTITDILERRGWESLDLLKVDIEGAENELFADPLHKRWIDRVRITVIELHDWLRPGCSSVFFRAMANLENIEMSLSGENIIIVNKNFQASQ